MRMRNGYCIAKLVAPLWCGDLEHTTSVEGGYYERRERWPGGPIDEIFHSTDRFSLPMSWKESCQYVENVLKGEENDNRFNPLPTLPA